MSHIIKSTVAISESGIIYNPNTGESFHTNEVGRLIVRLMKNGYGFDEIKNALMEEFDVDESACEVDIYDFISELKAHNLIGAAPGEFS